MKRTELLARSFIMVAALVAIAVPAVARARTPLIHARMAEAGGWNPSVLRARVGETLHLRLTSDDVEHGFAVGQMDMASVDVLPGKVTELDLLFDHPGSYTFYCTRWCGINHWRMRGTIEVSGEAGPKPTPAAQALYVQLGLDIDAPHNAPSVPDQRPAARRGESLASSPALTALFDPQYYRSHSPYQAWAQLRSEPTLNGSTDQELWDGVALAWRSNATAEGLAEGRDLFARNCAACHGEQGSGKGVFAAQLAAQGEMSAQTMEGAVGMTGQQPADFTNAKRMLGASPAILQGKILRGGMGTSMPMWGSIFTEEQMWNLVAYLYSFQFEYP